MEPCPTRGELERRVRGELATETVERLDHHLVECPECRQRYGSICLDHQFLGQAGLVTGDYGASHINPLSDSEELNRTLSQESGSAIDRSTNEPRDSLPRVEGYELLRVIGRGGMGIVYEAVQTKLGRRVALKLLPHVLGASSPDLVTRFRREAAAAAQLHHTNIIPIYDSGECRDGYYYAMELIEGQPMNELIRRLAAIDAPRAAPTALAELITAHSSTAGETTHPVGAVSDRDRDRGSGPVLGSSSTGSRPRPYYLEAARWIADAADAVHYAHRQGLVHRDLKPSNLMVCRDGRVMVLDFGLVKSATEASVTATGALLGTYRYMSPEQVGAKRVPVDQRTDVYSLGATLYELLTFRPAFLAQEHQQLLKQVLFDEPLPPKKLAASVPSELQTICLKCLEKSPDSRYTTAAELAADLRRYLHDLPITARPVGMARRAVKFVRRHRWSVASALATGLLIASVTYAMHLRVERQQQRLESIRLQVREAWQEGDSFAENECREALAQYPEDWRLLYNCGSAKKDQWIEQKNRAALSDAASLIERATQVLPSRYEGWNALCAVYREQERYSEAACACEKALQLNDSAYETYITYGLLQVRLGQLDRAEQTMKDGVSRAGSDAGPMPWHNLAAVQLLGGQADAAKQSIEAAIQNNTEKQSPRPYILKASILLWSRSTPDRRTGYDAAVTAESLAGSERDDAWRARAKRMLALAALRTNDPERATDLARSAIDEGDPLPAYAHLIAAVAEADLGHPKKAREELESADRHWPEWFNDSGQSMPRGSWLWFDAAKELSTLHEEVEKALAAAGH